MRTMRKSGLDGLWDTPEQVFTSAKTSRRQTPGLFSRMPVPASKEPGRAPVNVDIGGGRFDVGTQKLQSRGVNSRVFDPFNRPSEHNQAVARSVCCGQADSATIANVLNVIRDPRNRLRVLRQAADAVGSHGAAYIWVSPNMQSRPGKIAGPTRDGWQEFRDIETYVPEVARVFSDVKVQRGYIVARKPRRRTCACPVR